MSDMDLWCFYGCRSLFCFAGALPGTSLDPWEYSGPVVAHGG